jgi:MYXO-CTERM domain-containing protein
VLHLSRVANGAFLLWVVYYVAAHFFENLAQLRFSFLLIAIGSGFGWLVSFAGAMPTDMWVPEGYVFYSLFANPHFPLAIALLALILLWSVTPWNSTRIHPRRLVGVAACTVGLGIVQPFCLLTAGAVLLPYALVRWVGRKRIPWSVLASGVTLGLCGLPFVLNSYLASTQNPMLAAWSAQNQTPSPPPWDYVLGYGLVLLLALAGAWVAIRRRSERDVFLLTWAIVNVVLLYIPFSLQRRLVLGLIVPLGLLGAIGWWALPLRRVRTSVVLAASGVTHFFLVAMSVAMALARHDALYISRDEWSALMWLRDRASAKALVAAAPQTGLYIPAWSGQRVYYGHRFETPKAERRRDEIEAFFAGAGTLFPEPDYVFYGPNERALSQGWQPDPAWTMSYRQGTVVIYAVVGE